MANIEIVCHIMQAIGCNIILRAKFDEFLWLSADSTFRCTMLLQSTNVKVLRNMDISHACTISKVLN